MLCIVCPNESTKAAICWIMLSILDFQELLFVSAHSAQEDRPVKGSFVIGAIGSMLNLWLFSLPALTECSRLS